LWNIEVSREEIQKLASFIVEVLNRSKHFYFMPNIKDSEKERIFFALPIVQLFPFGELQ
jgi:hypothetical protein